MNCGQTNIPTTDETPLPCEDFRSTRCTLHEDAIAYLGLAADTPLNEVLDALLTSLTDARSRILVLEDQPAKLINTETGVTYTFVGTDAENRVTFDNASPIAVTVPDDATLDFVLGTEITLINIGAGTVTIGGAGITFIENIGLTIPSGASRTIIKIAADTWVIKY